MDLTFPGIVIHYFKQRKKPQAIYTISAIFFLLVASETKSQLIRGFIRQAAKQSTRSLPKFMAKAGVRTIPRRSFKMLAHDENLKLIQMLEANSELARPIQSNIKDFFLEKHKIIKEELLDKTSEFGRELFFNVLENSQEYPDYNEVIRNKKFPALKLSLFQATNRSSLSKKDLAILLHGGEVDSLVIDSVALYALYLKYSDSFATKEYNSMAEHYRCEDSALQVITKLASDRNIFLDPPICELTQEEEAEWWEICLGLLIIFLLVYLLRKIYKSICLFFLPKKKIIKRQKK